LTVCVCKGIGSSSGFVYSPAANAFELLRSLARDVIAQGGHRTSRGVVADTSANGAQWGRLGLVGAAAHHLGPRREVHSG